MIRLLIICYFVATIVDAREFGQTEITTEKGIEVYQKKNIIYSRKKLKLNQTNLI